MSSEQGINRDNASGGKVPSREPSPAREAVVLEAADAPGFEYELEENISEVSEVHSQPGMPRFDDYRHPNIKLFVNLFALLTFGVLLLQANQRFPRLYPREICSIMSTNCAMKAPTFSEFAEFLLRFYLEIVCPLSVTISFLACQLVYSAFPRLALKFENPVPSLLMLIAITCFFNCITDFLASIAMLPYISTTSRPSVWFEYLGSSFGGFFWFYALLNLMSFGQLTKFNLIRAREKYEAQRMMGEGA